MIIKVGEWVIEFEEGYFSVSFPMGEHEICMFYSDHKVGGGAFVQVDIDNKKLATIDLPDEVDKNG